MEVFAVVVDLEDLFDTVVAAFVASMAVAFVASLGIWGVTKYVDLGQDGRMVSAALALGVGAFGFLATLAIIALGLYLMISG